MLSRVTSDDIARYNAQTGKQLVIHEKAIGALDNDCQKLAVIINYAVEQEIFLDHSQFGFYSQKIVKGLGQEYDPARLRMLSDMDKLRDIIIQLQNHRTPIQFLRALDVAMVRMIYLPDGSHLYATVARGQWRAEKLAYGRYRLDDDEYRVVPFIWLRLETIAQWREEEVISLRNGTYLGYKKREPFTVKIGRSTIEGQECFLPNKKRYYIWVALVPHGDLLIVDGRPYAGSAGLDWHTSLELGFSEQGEPLIVLVFDSLKAFYPINCGQRLSVRTSQGHEETRYALDNEHGLCQLHRAIRFHLHGLPEPLTITIDLADKSLSSKTIATESSILFSTSTRKRIPSGTKREWGDQHFYLFTAPNKEVQVGEGIALEKLDVRFGQYAIYIIEWEVHTSPFSLNVGEESWHFERQRFFYLTVRQQVSQSPVHLTGNQIHRFTQENIALWTN